MLNRQNKPPGAIDCHYVEQREIITGINNNSKFCEYYTTNNYFFITNRPDSFTIEGWLGRTNEQQPYFEKAISSYSFFQDYESRRTACFTFDKTTLYKVVSILPEKPLKFILKQVQDLSNLKSMLNQEEIFQLLQKKQWHLILHILYQNKNGIANDILLQQAARTFESEFLKAIDENPVVNVDFTGLLEKLFMLHAGRFFTLQPASHRQLTIALAKRKPGKEGYNYASLYPNDEETKPIIQQFESENYFKDNNKKILSSREWIEIYNRLFDLINDKENSETYFTGPRFIKVIQEFDRYFPDYGQYIQLRNEEGKSASRKIFFYDILMEKSEQVRLAIIERVLTQVSRAEPEKVQAIRMLMGQERQENSILEKTQKEILPPGTPVVFISYSWDNPEHEKWILNLAGLLRANGVDVILDKYDLKAGKNLLHFMEQAIKKANKVLIIFTPNYKLKAENRTGGVGYEYSIMNVSLYKDQTKNDKIIPVLRQGSQGDSIPEFMQQFIHLDLRDDETFQTRFTDLLRDIFDEPAIKKPKLGNKPTF